jgi:hypothetical protein
VAQNTGNRRSAIDGRTTRHPGYAFFRALLFTHCVHGKARPWNSRPTYPSIECPSQTEATKVEEYSIMELNLEVDCKTQPEGNDVVCVSQGETLGGGCPVLELASCVGTHVAMAKK